MFQHFTSVYVFCVSLCSEFNSAPRILNFSGTKVTLRQGDGSLVYSSVPPYIALLHEYCSSARWEDALCLCRLVKVSSPFLLFYRTSLAFCASQTSAWMYVKQANRAMRR